MLPRSEESWSHPRVLVFLAVIFLCGAAFGSALTRTYLHSKMSWYRPQPIEAVQQLGLERLQRQLNLSPEQIKTVNKELDDYAKYYQNIEEEREDVAEHGRQRIFDVLNDAQKKRFSQIFGTGK
jgi:hypothetical protein